MPSTRQRSDSTKAQTAPIAPSTWSQSCSRRHSSARALRGSTVPCTVVPATATTANGLRPSKRSCVRALATASGCRRPLASVGRARRPSGGSPITAAALLRETWAADPVRTTARGSAASPAALRAQTRAIRLLRLPPLAGTPPLLAPRPTRVESQWQRRRSKRLRDGDSSWASRLLFRPAAIMSAAMETDRAGGSRWAKAPGWLGRYAPAITPRRPLKSSSRSRPCAAGATVASKVSAGRGAWAALSPSHSTNSAVLRSSNASSPGSGAKGPAKQFSWGSVR